MPSEGRWPKESCHAVRQSADDWMLAKESCLHIGSIPHRLLKEMLEHLPAGLKGEFLQALINTQANTQLVREALLRGETVNGARLERRSHIRID